MVPLYIWRSLDPTRIDDGFWSLLDCLEADPPQKKAEIELEPFHSLFDLDFDWSTEYV